MPHCLAITALVLPVYDAESRIREWPTKRDEYTNSTQRAAIMNESASTVWLACCLLREFVKLSSKHWSSLHILVRNNCAAISYTNSSCVVTFITGGKVPMISTQVKVAKRVADKCMYISMCTKDL